MTENRKLKVSIGHLLSVTEHSDKISMALYALSTLLREHADNGGELEELQTEGLSVLLDSLQVSLSSSVCDNRDALNYLKEFSQITA